MRKVLTFWVGIALVAASALASRAQGAQLQRVPQATPSAIANLTPLGDLPATNHLSLAIGLPLRNQEALTNLLRQIYDPASLNFHHYLSVQEFTEQFGPTTADYEAVAAFAQAHGLRVVARHPNRLLLDVEGSVADIEKSLNVHFKRYQHPTEDREFYAPDVSPQLDLSVPVLGISGLDNFSLPRPRLQVKPLAASANATPDNGSGPGGLYMGRDFRTAYASGTTLTGTGQTVGLLEFDGYTTSDITYYEGVAGLTNVPLTNVLLDGFSGAPSGGQVEVSLDIEVAISMAPGLSQMIVYEAGPYGNFHDILNRMANDNLAKQMSCSWYIPNGPADPVADGIFQEMAMQGQTFYAASGDSDAYSGLIPFPGDTPYITEVGGTTLTMSPGGGAYESETVWNWGYAGSSGGISTQYPIPSWQAPVSMAANYGSTTMRNTPDVAMTADSVYVRVDGDNLNVGGTSCAAPLWAGFTALINQQASYYGKPLVGFLNPTIYTLGLGTKYGTSMHDIITGNNGTPTHFPAVAGYDLATGWGTPNGQPLINAIVPPDSLIITPNTGFASTGAEGGPFSVGSQTYALTNISASNLTWAVSNSASWLSISTPGGTLAAGAATNLVVSLNAMASNLPAGAYSTTLLVTNVTTGFLDPLSFTLNLHDPLVITPANGFASVGPVGGPFSIPAQNCTLSNSGLVALNWSLSNDASWLDVTASSGTLAPGTRTNLVVSLNPVANSLPPGFFTGDLLFSNDTLGSSQDLQFSLETGQLPLDNGGFELGNFTGWTLSGNTTGSSVTSNPQFVHSGIFGAELGPDGSLGHLSQSLATVPGQVYLISFWLDNQALGSGNEFQVNWEGENVYDQFNIGTLPWTNIQVLVAATSPNSVLDFGFVNNGYDFGLDDVQVFQVSGVATNPPVITSQPTNETVTAGFPAQFSAGVSGIGPFYYQWLFNSSNVLGATNASLVLSPATAADAGTYSLMVSNAFGVTNSSNATLTVIVPPCDPPGPGLVSWWAGEGTADDSFGTDNGTLEGGAGYVAGEVGQAFSFDGVSGTMVVPDSPSLRLINQFTLETWIKPFSTNGDQSIMGKVGGAGGNNGYQFTLHDNELTGQLNSPGQGWPSEYVQVPVPIVLGTWSHIAWTYNQSALVLYFNGQPVGTNVVGPLTIATGVSNFRLSGDDNQHVYFDGDIDEASVYTQALSAAQIQAIYNAGSSGKCPGPPTIVLQPTSQTVISGSTATFAVEANGSQPLAYQWFLGTTPISATTNATATNATLVLTNVQLGQSGGLYSVVISNLAGSTNSSNALLTVTSPPPCDPPPAGLVSWWKGEGNANDAFGTNNGILEGGVTFTNGEVGQAFEFNGSSAYVDVPDSPSLRLTNQITIEAWIKPLTTNGDQNIVDKVGGTGGLYGYQLALHNNELTGQFNGPGLPWPYYIVQTPVPVVLGTWNHVAWTYDQSVMRIYFNGQQVATNQVGPQPIGSPSIDLYMGYGPYFNGAIDEASIYNTALTAAQIQAIYNAGSSGKCPSPPTIVLQPTNQTVISGSTATFAVEANGSQPLAYQWFLGTTPISATTNATATNATLVLTNVQLGQSGGLYSVVISNLAGSTNSSNALLTVTSPPPCDPPPAGLVSWWKGEGNANDAFGTNNGILEGGAGYVAGEVGQAFSFDGVSGTMVVPDSPGLRLINQFTLETWIKPFSTNGDQSIMGKVGGAGGNNGYQFTLHDNELTGQLNSPGQGWPSEYVQVPVPIVLGTWSHIAWTYNQSALVLYFNGQPVGTNVVGPLTIATGVSNFRLSGDDNQHVYFDGDIDEASVYTQALSAAQIQAIYNAGSSGKCPGPPTIVLQPTSQTVISGSTATFAVEANGSQPLAYQWFLGTTPISATTNATATNATLVLTNVQLGQSGGLYSVVISNLAGSTNSSNALLTVTSPPPCDPPPAGLVSWWKGEGNANDAFGTNNGILEGGVTFTNGEVGQAFEFNGSSAYVDVPDSPSLRLTNQITIEAWIKPLTTNGDEGIVSKVSSATGLNGYQFGLHNNQLLGLFNSPGQPWPSSAILSATPVVPGNWYHVAWTYDQSVMNLYINGQLVGTNLIGPLPIATSSSDLYISGPSGVFFTGEIDEASIYNTALTAAQIQAIYNAGSAGKCPVPVPPVIASQPTNESVVLGGMASFAVTANGSPPLAYQWLLNNSTISPLLNPSAATATLMITNIQATNAGNYSVLVTNIAGSTNSSNALLTILFPPSITLNPASVIAGQGCDVIFNSGATGTGTLTYQWQKGGSNLIGQTGTNLAILGIQPSDFGNYAMVASNSYGTATSSIATLSLEQPPVAGSVIVRRYPTGGIHINVSTILAGATDPESNVVSLVSINPASLAGGTVGLTNGVISYLPPSGYTNADAFNYTLSDGLCGGITVGTVLVEVRTDLNPAAQVIIVPMTNGSVQVIFTGEPGTAYRVQAATLLDPSNWQDVSSNLADPFGDYIYTDWPATNGPFRYFRSVTP